MRSASAVLMSCSLRELSLGLDASLSFQTKTKRQPRVSEGVKTLKTSRANGTDSLTELLLYNPGDVLAEDIEFDVDDRAFLYLVEVGYVVGEGDDGDLEGVGL